MKVLRYGDFCGEISMIYGCARTATVTSSKYSTLAKIDHAGFKDLLIEFPETIAEMKYQIYHYNDRMKQFMINSITKIKYFQDIS